MSWGSYFQRQTFYSSGWEVLPAAQSLGKTEVNFLLGYLTVRRNFLGLTESSAWLVPWTSFQHLGSFVYTPAKNCCPSYFPVLVCFLEAISGLMGRNSLFPWLVGLPQQRMRLKPNKFCPFPLKRAQRTKALVWKSSDTINWSLSVRLSLSTPSNSTSQCSTHLAECLEN